MNSATAAVGGRAGGEGKQLQARIPGAQAEAEGACLLKPAPLLPRESGQVSADTGGACKAKDERDACLAQRGRSGWPRPQ
jgi:hypothetical protein